MKNFDPQQPSQGLGDTVAKVTTFFHIDKVADAIAKLAGAKDCGCDERREMLNNLFPYEEKIRKFKVLKQFRWDNITYEPNQELEVNKQHPLSRAVIVLVGDKMIEEL